MRYLNFLFLSLLPLLASAQRGDKGSGAAGVSAGDETNGSNNGGNGRGGRGGAGNGRGGAGAGGAGADGSSGNNDPSPGPVQHLTNTLPLPIPTTLSIPTPPQLSVPTPKLSGDPVWSNTWKDQPSSVASTPPVQQTSAPEPVLPAPQSAPEESSAWKPSEVPVAVPTSPVAVVPPVASPVAPSSQASWSGDNGLYKPWSASSSAPATSIPVPPSAIPNSPVSFLSGSSSWTPVPYVATSTWSPSTWSPSSWSSSPWSSSLTYAGQASAIPNVPSNAGSSPPIAPSFMPTTSFTSPFPIPTQGIPIPGAPAAPAAQPMCPNNGIGPLIGSWIAFLSVQAGTCPDTLDSRWYLDSVNNGCCPQSAYVTTAQPGQLACCQCGASCFGLPPVSYQSWTVASGTLTVQGAAYAIPTAEAAPTGVSSGDGESFALGFVPTRTEVTCGHGWCNTVFYGPSATAETLIAPDGRVEVETTATQVMFGTINGLPLPTATRYAVVTNLARMGNHAVPNLEASRAVTIGMGMVLAGIIACIWV